MKKRPVRGGFATRQARLRRLLIVSLVLAIAVIIVAIVRLSVGGETDLAGLEPASTTTAVAEEPEITSAAGTATGNQPTTTEPAATTTMATTTTIVTTTTTQPPTTTTEPTPATTTEPPPTTTTEPPPTTTTEPPTTTTTTTEPPPPPPVAWLTASGIPVTVLEVLDEGHLVRTPCGGTAEINDGQRIDPVRVVLDPGHGGPVETGTVGPNGLVERDLNLTLADAVLAELAERGISATTTRTGNYMVRLGVRAEFADAVEPEALVSIHHNGPTWDLVDTPGTEIYVQSEAESESGMRPASGRLGGLLYEEIVEALSAFEGVQWSGLPDAGVRRVVQADGTDTYALVRLPETPAVLVEYGYLTNASEAEFFATEEYIAVAAAATANAIEAFLETDQPGSGFIPEPRFYDPDALDIPCTDPPLEPPPAEDTGPESDPAELDPVEVDSL